MDTCMQLTPHTHVCINTNKAHIQTCYQTTFATIHLLLEVQKMKNVTGFVECLSHGKSLSKYAHACMMHFCNKDVGDTCIFLKTINFNDDKK